MKVLFVLGWGRSGSTLLDALLGHLDGFFSAGEIRWLWERLPEKRRCSCGKTLSECSIWSCVVQDVLEIRPLMSPEKIVSLQREVARVRHVPRLLVDESRRKLGSGRVGEYLEVMAELYQATAKRTGARVIVDSSKLPSDAILLRNLPGIDPYLVHLVRDPRAVANSWQRHMEQPDHYEPGQMMRRGTLDSGVKWIGWNAAAEIIKRRYGAERSMLLRYEDFARGPRRTVEAIARMTGENPPRLPFESESVATLGGNHMAAGNPSRYRTGRVEIRPDEVWRSTLSAADRRLTTLVCLPLLRRYRYGLTSR